MLRIMFLLPAFLLSAITASHACNIDIYANHHMKPKVYLESGQPKGILVDMMLFVGEDIDCQFNFKFSTWARAYKSMLNGDGGVIGLSKTASREEVIDYSDVMYMEDVLIITHIDNAFEYSNINDLAGKSIAFSRAANYSDEFEQALQDKIFTVIVDSGDVSKRLERVAKKRVDVAIISPGKFAFNNAFIDHPKLLTLKDQLYIVPTVLNKDPNFLGFSKQYDHKLFLKRFNESIKKGRSSGVFEKIEMKYHHLQD